MAAKKDGLVWISERTKQWRYSAGGDNQWMQPLSIYIAGEDIKRGQAVSIAIPADVSGPTKVTDPSVTDDDGVAVLTRTARHLKTLGIALEPAAAGAKFHVQPFGQFVWVATGTSSEYTPGFVNGDRGKLVYVSNVPGGFTTDIVAASLNGSEIIQVGFISSTPVDGTVVIEIQPEGDGRGPIDQTQYETIFGEQVSFPVSPMGGTYPKVFAIQDNYAGSTFQYNFRANRPNVEWPQGSDPGYNKWIAIWTQNAVHITIMGPGPTPSATDIAELNAIINSVPGGNVTYSSLYTGSTPPPAWGSPWSNSVDPLTPFSGDVATAIVHAFTNLSTVSGYTGAQVNVISQITNTSIGVQTSVDILLEATQAFGPIYVAWDSALDFLFENGSHMIEQGAYATSPLGSAILGDRSVPDRTNLLGFYLGQGSPTPINPGTTGIFLRKGLMTFLDNWFTPGVEYYLEHQGNLTPRPASIPPNEPLIFIGTAMAPNQLLVDINGIRSYQRQGDYPIGAMKTLPVGVDVAEYSWLLMDGTTSYPQTSYPQLFEDLVARYGSPEIVDPGNASNFIVPLLTHPVFGNHYEIKAQPYGNQSALHSTDVQRVVGTLPYANIDVSNLMISGPQGVIELPNIDNILVKLFFEVTALSENWAEATPGTYAWSVSNTGSTWLLHLTPTSTITYWNGSALTAVASGQRYKVIIYKTALFAKYSEFDVDIGSITLSVLDTGSPNPVNSTAVVNYITTSVTTDALQVDGNTLLGDSDSRISSFVGLFKAVKFSDSSVQATWTGDTGDIRIANLTDGSGAFANTLPSGAVANSLIPKAYADVHINQNFSTSVALHGFKVGAHNTISPTDTFNVDRVDNLHVGINTIMGGTVPSTTLDPTLMYIPYVDGSSITDGLMRVGGTVELNNLAGDRKVRISFGGTDELIILGAADADDVSLTLGSKISLTSNGSGNLKIGATAGAADGSVLAHIFTADNFNTISSREFKTNIEKAKINATELINTIKVVSYTYKNDLETPKIGFIAEDTNSLLSTPKKNSMDMSNVLGTLLLAVQELDERISDLELGIKRTRKLK